MSDLTIAASEEAFVQLFTKLRDSFTYSASDSGSFGPFSASYSLALHLDNGSIDLTDGAVEITGLDVVFDSLAVEVCFNLPGFCIGGWCIVPDPWNGCLVSFPGFCIGGPICVPLDLSGLVSEITQLRATLRPQYFVDPGRDPTWSDLTAEFNGVPNKWQIYLDPDRVIVNPFDIPATIANVLESVVRSAIDAMFPWWVPDWAKDLMWALLGPIVDLVKGLLGIVDAFDDWLLDLLADTFGLFGLVETAIADFFAAQYPIEEFEDPFPILEAYGGLIPVKIPIRNLAVTVTTDEMVIEGDVG
jgi:hypothetical protein